jgi:hypothetical protein
MDSLFEAYLGVYEEFVPLTPDKEEKVKERVGELFRDIQLSSGNVKSLRKKPLAKFRPKVKNQISSNISTAKRKGKLVLNANDALIRSSVDREASARSKINQLKNQLGKNNIRKFNREELEYILDILISEGFAVDYDSAGCILEVMSDEWLGSLIDEKFNPDDYKEYHQKKHVDDDGDQSDKWDAQEKDWQASRGDIRDHHNQARNVKKEKGKK